MAVIYRDRLVGDAKQIADKGIAAQIAAGDTSLIALQQQRAINDALQQQLVAQTNATLGQVSENIYRAQRAKKAESAMLGLAGDVAAIRDISQTQDVIASELSNVINQTEQGAIGIAGQQSAINKAEVQTAQGSVLDAYADRLIETNVAKQDTGRMVMNGLFGAVTGALEGVIGGSIFNMGVKGLLNPSSGLIKKTISGLGAMGALAYGANNIGNLVNIGNQNYGDGKELYGHREKDYLMQGLLGGGAALGAGVGLFDKFGTQKNLTLLGESGTGGTMFTNPKWASVFANRNKAINLLKGSKAIGAMDDVAKAAASTAAKQGGWLAKLTGAGAKGAQGVSNLMKINPYLLAISAGIGAIVGGLKGGMKKKYYLNLDDIRGTDTYSQFQDFGLDVDAVADIVYNK